MSQSNVSGNKKIAIDTVYRGYRFRSRIEARWAVFFDSALIKWEYEKEGIVLPGSGFYLPDFWLSEQQCWIEIKGDIPTDIEQSRCIELAAITGNDVYLFFGQVPFIKDGEFIEEHDGAYWFGANGGVDNYQRWCECLCQRHINIEHAGNPKRYCKCGAMDSVDFESNDSTQRIATAYLDARSARFEHQQAAA